MKANFLALSSAAVLSMALAACTAPSDKGHMDGAGMNMDGEGHDEEITFGEAGMVSEVSRTITVTMKDVAYDLKDLTVKDGETIRFIVVNKDDTEHEFTLGTMEMNAADRAKMEKQMDQGESMEMMEPNAVSVAGLETKELIWKFKGPSKIEFACNVPGHYEAGMKGEITVTK